MSGSFWKFGQDYTTESPITKILNSAFIKIGENENSDSNYEGKDGAYDDLGEHDASGSNDREIKSQNHADMSKTDRYIDDDNDDDDDEESKNASTVDNDDTEGDSDNSKMSKSSVDDTLPTNEADFVHYRPNLDVLDDLLDDEELYTELMCSNFKLLIFLKYPEVLSRLIDYVTNENVLEESIDGPVLPEEINDDAEVEDEINPRYEKLQEELKGEDVQHEPRGQDNQYDQEQEEVARSDNTQEDEELKSEGIQEENNEDDISEISEETSITLPPESEEQVESRRACMAAEILSADVWPISSAIMDNEELISKLWCIMDHTSPLSIVASTYFMKINERLLDMDISGMMEFILQQMNVVDRFLNHIDNPPLMDFLLKVISTDKPDTPTGIIEVLKSQDLIPKLLDHLNPEYDTATQSAAGDFLKAFVTISANSNNELASGIGPNELTRQLVSPKMMEKLIKIMLKGGTSLSNGVGIIIELIRKNNSDYDFVHVMYTTLETHPPNDRDPIYLGHLVKLFAKYMPLFNGILVKTKLSPLETPFGSIEPLGFERFKICELVAELLHCSNMTLINEKIGEKVVHERDVVREKIIAMEMQARKGHTGDSNTVSTEDEEPEEFQKQDKTQEEGEEVFKKLGDLDLSNNRAEEEEEESNNDEASSGDNDTGIRSEDSSDSEPTEKSLRNNAVVGDQLKIALHDTQIISTILRMFFRFAWNNFLHNVVFDIVQQIFNGPAKTGYNRFLLADLLIDANITKMIMDGDKKCADYEKETGLRLGYMGHLTLIAEEVAKFSAYVEEMKITFSDSGIWESLNEPIWKKYTETSLAETREKYNTVLGDFGDEENDINPDDMINENDCDENDIDQDYVTHEGKLNGPNSYLDFLESAHDDNGDDDDKSSNLEKSRYYEYTNGDGTKTRLQLDPSIDYDLPKDKIHEEPVNDEDDTEEDNRFSNYMSHQLGRSFAGSSNYGNEEFDNDQHDDQHDDQDDVESPGSGHDESWMMGSGAFPITGTPRRSQPSNPEIYDKNVFQHQFELIGAGEEDDYMDPNDDGQSYAKPNHPLYNNTITPTASHRPNDLFYKKASANDNEDDISDDSDAELEDEMELVEKQNDVTASKEDNDNGYSLCRSTSKDNLVWDENEQDRLMEMINYNRQQNANK